MKTADKRMKIGIISCWALMICLFLIILSGLLYNGFLNKYKIVKLEDYLYSAECSGYNYVLTGKILETDLIQPGCSTVRKGNIAGRNFDWTYDDSCEFVVKTPAEEGRHAVLGVSSLSGITEKAANKFRRSITYSLLPFYTVDGINDAGLFACVNEVPSGDAGITTGTNPGAERLCTVIAVRYVLDYASDVDEAIAILKEKDLFSYKMDGEPYEVHFMLSDPLKNAVVEIVNNEVRVVEDCNIMTNFYLSLDGYTDHSEGIERYNILTEAYDGVTDARSLRELLKKVYYSGLYDPEIDPVWYSEAYGDHVNASGEEFTYFSDPADFPNAMEEERAGYEDRVRDGHFWQTCHTSVYDLEKKTLSVSVQEHDQVYDYTLTPLSDFEAQKQANSRMRQIMVPINAYILLLDLLMLFAMLFENQISDMKSRCFTWLILASIAAVLSDLGAWLYDGMASHAGMLAVCNYFAIVLTEVMLTIFVWYEYFYLKERKDVPKRPAVLVSAFNGVVVTAFTVLAICGKLFYIEDGVFFPTDMMVLSTAAAAIDIVVILYTIFHSRRILGTHDTIAFASYGIIPLAVAVYEIFNPSVEIGFVAGSLATLLIFIMLQSGKTNKLKMRQELLEEICYIDQMTGLNNRRAYDEMLDKGNNASSCGVIFCDVNGLKYANDHYGHKAGDALLVRFANLLLDYFDSEKVFRISGDEFVVIMRDIAESDFDNGLERFKNGALSSGDIASVGGAFSTEETAATLVAKAEKQMYRSKAEFYERHPEYDRRKRS